MDQLREVEYARLAARVEEIQRLLNSGKAAGAEYLLQNFLTNASARMQDIRAELNEDEKKHREKKEKALGEAMYLAQMEHRLSEAEQEQYAGFLTLEYFRKSDLDELESFYARSWDRLSECGKTEMSTRVWEGVRREEFTFEELPENMRRRETDRTYLQLTGKAEKCRGLPEFSSETKAAFIGAYETGKATDAAKILSRGAAAEYPTDHRSEGAEKAPSLTKGPEHTPVQAEPQVKETDDVCLDGMPSCSADSIAPTDLRIPAESRKR